MEPLAPQYSRGNGYGHIHWANSQLLVRIGSGQLIALGKRLRASRLLTERLRALLTVMTFSLAAAGCAPTNDLAWRPSATEIRTADHGAYPSNYEAIVKSWYLRNLKDPDSARFGRITRPLKEHAIRNIHQKLAVYGYSVCAAVNSRNSFGGYTGSKVRWFLIRNGRIVRTSPPRYHIYIGRPYRCIDGPIPG